VSVLLPVTCHGCDRPLAECGDSFVRTVKGALCCACWIRLKRPGAGGSAMQETYEAEVVARERMQARGGTDRHLVRNGMS
jgi:hypothetical protein